MLHTPLADDLLAACLACPCDELGPCCARCECLLALVEVIDLWQWRHLTHDPLEAAILRHGLPRRLPPLSRWRGAVYTLRGDVP